MSGCQTSKTVIKYKWHFKSEPFPQTLSLDYYCLLFSLPQYPKQCHIHSRYERLPQVLKTDLCIIFTFQVELGTCCKSYNQVQLQIADSFISHKQYRGIQSKTGMEALKCQRLQHHLFYCTVKVLHSQGYLLILQSARAVAIKSIGQRAERRHGKRTCSTF